MEKAEDVTRVDGSTQLAGPRATAAENEAIRAAATALYLAGRWDCPNVTPRDAARLWEGLRDALGLPVGTATAHGVQGEYTDGSYD